MKIIRAKKTKVSEIDFQNLDFGSVFSDHMFSCSFKNGEWDEGMIEPYRPILMDPSARTLHYGQACFEGMKAYKDSTGKPWLFRPIENYKRIVKSCKRLAMPELPEKIFMDGVSKLVDVDRKWIKPGIGNSLYIRPFIFADQPSINANEADQYKFMIICSPAQLYYSGNMKVKIEKSFTRAAKGGVGYAKAAGNYAAQFYPTMLARNEGYQQIIWTDSSNHEYIEEAGTMNLFFRINDTLITPPTNDSILDGITRKSLIEIAQNNGINVVIKPVSITGLLNAHRDGTLKEIFGCGTAVVILPIVGFGHENKYYELKKMENCWALNLKDKLNEIQYNISEDPYGWRVGV